MKKQLFRFILPVICLGSPFFAAAQDTTYYIDGYHGGAWGHYPDWNTRFMVDMLKTHPAWNINIEIEPETWDRAEKVDLTAFQDFKAMLAGPAYTGRIEYVNPAYAQSYLYNIDGESIIRQFSNGMKMLRGHFPEIEFTSYSSEEPCFTSALPQILTSFGIKYASLKNPNTCFGGYTRAHGSELVSWEGPDGSRILTSPRYAVESLDPKSTWQTIAWNNSPKYISAAFAQGIKHPVGMTFQDAGWKGGPFQGGGIQSTKANRYVTWRQYFNIVKNDPAPVWKFSQEDVLVSLVWGSQVTQRIAQQVRVSENKLLGMEKLLSLVSLYKPLTWPQAGIDSAWRTLLLSQHHDCWIVPYNGKPSDTWADKVVKWTDHSNHIADSLVNDALPAKEGKLITVYNTQLRQRSELIEVSLPESLSGNNVSVINAVGVKVPSQLVTDTAGHKKILFQADVPGFGYSKYKFEKGERASVKRMADAVRQGNGTLKVETDIYAITIDPARGGAITSLYDKILHKELVDKQDTMGFNSLRGNFYRDSGYKSTTKQTATVKVLENGPLRVKLQISGTINNTPVSQVITLAAHQRIIDIELNIDWKHNTGIGDSTPKGTYDWKNYHKAFYNDRSKLLAVFPLKLKGQKVYKNAPFDVTESRLKNTFYTSWDSIKNNVILNWVDVTDAKGQYGMALFSDHTTGYVHGENFPLGLIVQYSGMGLWGRDYTINGPTHIHYAFMPHKGKWDEAKVWSASAGWNEPLTTRLGETPKGKPSMIAAVSDGLVLTSARTEGAAFTMRVFNAEGGSGPKTIKPNFKYHTAVLKNLDGKTIKTFTDNTGEIRLNIPRFGLRTIEFSGMQQ